MPAIAIVRFLFSLLGLAVLVAAGYLLWTWRQGEVVEYPDGVLRVVRQDWRLSLAVALLAWNFLGRFVTLPLLAKGGGVPSRPVRGEGRMIPGADGSELYVEAVGPGDAPVMMLTHGWGLDSTIWNYAKRDLGQLYRVITWDLPGLGKSRAGKGTASTTSGWRPCPTPRSSTPATRSSGSPRPRSAARTCTSTTATSPA